MGYTNAGKSTLLNALSGADAYIADQLFATLDPITRRITLPSGREVLLTDTVGFIKKLPTHLVAAFRATLEEVTDADLLLHVVDITQGTAIEQSREVEAVLEQLEAIAKPTIVVLNKVDKLDASQPPMTFAGISRWPMISAAARMGWMRYSGRLKKPFLYDDSVKVKCRIVMLACGAIPQARIGGMGRILGRRDNHQGISTGEIVG